MSERDAHLPLVLVVDDKRNMVRLMAKVLGGDARVRTAGSGSEALRIVESEPVEVVLSDLQMPGMDGLELLKKCKERRPGIEFVLMTAYATVPTAVEALRLGAYDYLTKPFEPEEARAVVLRAIGRAAASLPGSGEEPRSLEVLPGMVARSASMDELGSLVRRVAESDVTVLLLGETGTGKERVAHAVHQLSPRAGGRFVAINCAALPAELLESELFGHAKGSFTGAANDRAGLFEEADGGTLFLDEIAEMRFSLQAKLTRALEERAVRRLGESRERAVDARVVAATHRNIEAMVADGSFREDLWYRLNVAAVKVPPLRERKEDVELLAAHFLKERTPQRGRRIIGFTSAAVAAMESFDWPGNVRQLRAAVERACVVSAGERIDVGDLPPEVSGARPLDDRLAKLADLTWSEAVEAGRVATARSYLEEVLRRHQGRVSDAATHAGVERESFYRLLRRYNLKP
ncbi:MAG: sigma-54-dependent Fis family transcriptional regulator [Deltaproteobacteria bacterium]|nr:sigma-54-dependent Fis family transcriptional regulator [Deltaproteobacteria bacterium]